MNHSDTPSAWLDTLRAACAQTTQGEVARRIGYSVTVVSQTLSGTYNGDLKRIQAAVEGAYLNATVVCPVAGEIARQRCIEFQRMPFRATNPANVQLYRACRSGCPHSLLAPDARFATKPLSAPAAPSSRAANAQPAVATNTGSPGAVTPQGLLPPRDGTVRPTSRATHPHENAT